MISDDIVAKNWEIVIIYATKTKNVSQTCNLFGISRTVYYKWLKRYKKYGLEGLKDKVPTKPNMPNQTPIDIEKKVLDIVKAHPEYGPLRIVYELENENVILSNTGVYKILKRNALQTKEHRCLYAKGSSKAIPVEKNVSTICFSNSELENSYPGFMLLQGTFYIDNLINEGAVYQITVIDCFSHFAFAKLYNKKSTENVINMLKTEVFPIFKVLEIDIKALTTNASKEYTTNYKNSKHRYEDFIEKNNIEHYIAAGVPEENLILLQEFHEEVYNKVYLKFINKEKKSSLEEFNSELNNYLRYHNLEKKIENGPCKQKTPEEVLTEYKGEDFPVPLWMYVDIMND